MLKNHLTVALRMLRREGDYAHERLGGIEQPAERLAVLSGALSPGAEDAGRTEAERLNMVSEGDKGGGVEAPSAAGEAETHACRPLRQRRQPDEVAVHGQRPVLQSLHGYGPRTAHAFHEHLDAAETVYQPERQGLAGSRGLACPHLELGEPVAHVAAHHLRAHLNECKPWRGVLDAQGYPRVKVKGRSRYAHRVEYERFWGRLKPGERVHRTCGNRTCTCAYHLTTTPPEQKKRRPGTTKLTPRQVRAIRKAWAEPDRPTQAALAKRYSVSRSCISLVVCGITWADV